MAKDHLGSIGGRQTSEKCPSQAKWGVHTRVNAKVNRGSMQNFVEREDNVARFLWPLPTTCRLTWWHMHIFEQTRGTAGELWLPLVTWHCTICPHPSRRGFT